ncbi:MAG TPA: glycoside hydrolase family 3 N-terminal domain-containing protein, partial [Candidatus Limnocylindrales bacterium]|nr:glycoside hydrolase family 3 N-terminal domain-containing protein [Candidatus Limnocylindrales bacterium]
MLSRRELLRAAILGATAAVVAACGATAPSTRPPTAEPTEPPSPSPGGIPTRVVPSPTVATDNAPPQPSLRDKIAGLIVVGFRGATLDEAPWLPAALRDKGLRGVILFDRDQITGKQRNVISPRQVTRLIHNLRAAAPSREIVVSIDQEGGVVTRLSPAHGFPAVASQATIGRGTVAAARGWANGLTATLASVGVNLNFAPVVDLNVNPRSAAIGALGRSFSADPDVVVAMATTEIEAHGERQIRTAIKHFPGI